MLKLFLGFAELSKKVISFFLEPLLNQDVTNKTRQTKLNDHQIRNKGVIFISAAEIRFSSVPFTDVSKRHLWSRIQYCTPQDQDQHRNITAVCLFLFTHIHISCHTYSNTYRRRHRGRHVSKGRRSGGSTLILYCSKSTDATLWKYSVTCKGPALNK